MAVKEHSGTCAGRLPRLLEYNAARKRTVANPPRAAIPHPTQPGRLDHHGRFSKAAIGLPSGNFGLEGIPRVRFYIDEQQKRTTKD